MRTMKLYSRDLDVTINHNKFQSGFEKAPVSRGI